MIPNLRHLSPIHLVFVLLQFHAATPARVPWVDTLPTLSSHAKFLKSVAVDHEHSGDVFVGGVNVLYRLSADLELRQNVSIGPVDDYPGCPAPPYPCSKRRVPTDNVARIVLLVYDPPLSPCLLLCGSVYRNLCQVRPLDNLTEFHWVHPYNETLGYTTNPDLNFALMERGFDGQMSLFTATYFTSPLSPLAAPFLSSKVLKRDGDRYHFRHAFQNDTVSSAVTFKNFDARIPIDGGFLYENYIYFPTLLTSGNSYTAHLVRFCSTDPTFRSYQVLPVQCDRRGKIIKLLISAHLGPSPHDAAGTKKSLYLVFHDDKSGSALCIHDMASVEKAFFTWPRICNRDVVGVTCDTEKVGMEIIDFCGSSPMFYDRRPYVVNQTLEVNSLAFISNMTVVAITVIKQNNDVVAFVGNGFGHILKISMQTGQFLNAKDMLDINTTGAFVSPFVLDREEKHIYLLIKNKIIKYPVSSCGVYETCHDCFVRGRKEDPLMCGWCAGRCALAEECADSFSTDTCTPTIYEVFPKKGPIQGGNTITITGDTFGKYVDEAHTSISVAGVPCKSSSWNNLQINCTLGSTPEEMSGPVELKVSNTLSLGYKIEGLSISETNFTYFVGARLYGIQPSKGPTSGGTLVRLYGEDLDDVKDKKCTVSVYGRPCILQRFDKNSVSCIIQNSTDPKFSNSTIALHVDGVAYGMDESPPTSFNLTGISQTFEYTPDPYINHVRPGITTLSGLMNLTAFGRFLDSVQFPKLVVKIDETQIIGESEMVEDCWTDPKSNGTRMTCRTPSLKDALIFPPATRTHPFIVQVSFLMDGVQKLKDFSKHRDDLSRLLYYPDPEFKVFHELEKVQEDQKMFEIKGKYLDLMHLADNLQVRIGTNETCKIASVSSDNLFCEIPRSLSKSTLQTNISVEVYVGTQIYHLGYIDIDKKDEGTGVWVILLVAVFVAICLFACLLYCKRIRRKKPIPISDMALRTAVPHDYRAVPTRTAETPSREPSSFAESPVAVISLVDDETKSVLAGKGLIILEKFLEKREKVGSGRFGCVFKGCLHLPNRAKIEVAVKTLQEHSLVNPENVQTFLKEALIMLDFHDPNVLGLYGVCLDGRQPSIVLPFMENGDLRSYIIDEDRDLKVSDLLKFAADVSSGMAYLEKNKFVHRDLAARNCVLDGDRNTKVADFGLSRDIYQKDYYCPDKKREALIPYRWSALESLDKLVFTSKSDVWSYGVMVWELMTRGITPYSHIDNFDILMFIKSGRRLDQPQYCPLPLYIAMLTCWNSDPDRRPTFHKLNEFVRELRNNLLGKEEDGSMPAPETVPANHTVYYNSEELYRSMEGRDLDTNFLLEI